MWKNSNSHCYKNPRRSCIEKLSQNQLRMECLWKEERKLLFQNMLLLCQCNMLFDKHCCNNNHLCILFRRSCNHQKLSAHHRRLSLCLFRMIGFASNNIQNHRLVMYNNNIPLNSKSRCNSNRKSESLRCRCFELLWLLMRIDKLSLWFRKL